MGKYLLLTIRSVSRVLEPGGNGRGKYSENAYSSAFYNRDNRDNCFFEVVKIEAARGLLGEKALHEQHGCLSDRNLPTGYLGISRYTGGGFVGGEGRAVGPVCVC